MLSALLCQLVMTPSSVFPMIASSDESTIDARYSADHALSSGAWVFEVTRALYVTVSSLQVIARLADDVPRPQPRSPTLAEPTEEKIVIGKAELEIKYCVT